MTPNEYQDRCKETLTPECENFNYLALGLASESGEVAGDVKKYMRNDFGWDTLRLRLLGELGDVLWYVSNLANEAGYSLQDVMKYNVEKLQKRQQNGTIKGDGDDR